MSNAWHAIKDQPDNPKTPGLYQVTQIVDQDIPFTTVAYFSDLFGWSGFEQDGLTNPIAWAELLPPYDPNKGG